MWQRFSVNAKKVVFYSQEEAQKFGEGYVSTEHLLLGILRDSDFSGVRALERLGFSANRVRNKLEEALPRGDGKIRMDITLAPRAKRVVNLAYDEANDLGNDYIGTEHLLLGLIHEGEGVAGRVLTKLGADLENARKAVRELQEIGGGEGPVAVKVARVLPNWESFCHCVAIAQRLHWSADYPGMEEQKFSVGQSTESESGVWRCTKNRMWTGGTQKHNLLQVTGKCS